MSKLFFKLSVLLLLIFLTGCSDGNLQNPQGRYDAASAQENITYAGKNEEQTSGQQIQEKTDDVKDLLNKESYELVWNVREKQFPDIVESWKISSVDMNALWERMKSGLFSDGQIQSDEQTAGERIIQIKSGSKIIDVTIESNNIAINGIDREENQNFYKKLSEFLSKETEMDCVEEINSADTDAQNGYSFQIADISLDQEGYPQGAEWIPGSFYEVDENGCVTVNGIIRKENISKKQDLKSGISIDDLKILCETQWRSSGFPFVCVLEDVKLVYMKSKDGTELIPAYCLDGKFYQKSSNGEITSKENSFLVNAVTGEIVRFV